MNIYFGGSIAGGRGYIDTYREIVDFLKEAGHHILTEHVVHPDVLELEEEFTPEQVYTRDIKWLTSSDCLIAEVSNPSLGVGYEICYALRINKPVLCIHREGILMTKMLSGNTSEGLTFKSYKDAEQWKQIIRDFLNRITVS